MSFKLGGIILEDLIILSPEEKKLLEDMGRPVPTAPRAIALTDKMILMVLASFADDRGRNIYPSRKRVARMAGGCSVRTIERAFEKFIADEVLAYDEPVDKHGRAIRRRTRCYRIDVAKAIELYAESEPDIGHGVLCGKSATEDSHDIKEDSMSSVVGHGVTESYYRTFKNPSRAREAARPPEGGRGGEPSPGATTEPPDPGHALAEAIAVFKTLRPAMREAIGEEAWNFIGGTLFVIGCGPGHMLLGQPTTFLRDQTLRHREAFERVSGMKVATVVKVCPQRAKGAA